MKQFYFKPPFQLDRAQEDVLVEEMLEIALGDDNYLSRGKSLRPVLVVAWTRATWICFASYSLARPGDLT